MHWRPQTLEKAQVYLQVEKKTHSINKKHLNFKVIDFNFVKDYTFQRHLLQAGFNIVIGECTKYQIYK